MGADIHGYIVYKDWERNGEQHYTEFSSGQLHSSNEQVQKWLQDFIDFGIWQTSQENIVTDREKLASWRSQA